MKKLTQTVSRAVLPPVLALLLPLAAPLSASAAESQSVPTTPLPEPVPFAVDSPLLADPASLPSESPPGAPGIEVAGAQSPGAEVAGLEVAGLEVAGPEVTGVVAASAEVAGIQLTDQTSPSTPLPLDVPTLISDTALRWNLSPDRLLRIAWCESRWDPTAVSFSGHLGLFQFAHSTWRVASQAIGLPHASPFDPAANTEAAAWLMSTEGFHHWGCR